MSKSNRLREEDARAVVRLIAEAVSLRLNPPEQEQRLADSVAAMFGAETGWFIAVDNYGPDLVPRVRSLSPCNGCDSHALDYAARMNREFPIAEDIVAGETRRIFQPVVATTMRALAEQVGWEKYEVFHDLARTVAITDILAPIVRFGPGDLSVMTIAVHRRGKTRPFNAREVALAEFLGAELRHCLLSGKLGDWTTARIRLTRRQRDVYERVLAGRSPKHIARQLQLSVHTVRDHVSDIYKQFGVSGRDELLARALGHHLNNPENDNQVT